MNTDHVGKLRPKILQPARDRHGDSPTLNATQVAQLSGISEDDVSSLIDYGVLKPVDPQGPSSFRVETNIHNSWS